MKCKGPNYIVSKMWWCFHCHVSEGHKLRSQMAPYISLQPPADSFLTGAANHIVLQEKQGREGLLINSPLRKSDANTLRSTGPRKSSYQISEIWLDLQLSGEI